MMSTGRITAAPLHRVRVMGPIMNLVRGPVSTRQALTVTTTDLKYLSADEALSEHVSTQRP